MAREYIPKNKFIRPEVWKRITSIIKDYNNLIKERDNLQGKKLAKTRIAELDRKIKAFEDVWNNSDRETQKLIRLKFWEGKTYRDMLLPMSESTMKRAVGRFVRALGSKLGEID